MLVPLTAARSATCGGKAAALGTLLRAGLPVPDGVVVPFEAKPAAAEVRGSATAAPCSALQGELASALASWGDPAVAVRSSAAHEDTPEASAAGQYESVLGLRGAAAVGQAVRQCWVAAGAGQVAAYWTHLTGETRTEPPAMAVIVQQLIDADASGVMFTPTAPAATTRIEASWGLGPAVVGGTVTPDSWQLHPGQPARAQLGHKATRIDRRQQGEGLTTTVVPHHLRDVPAITESTARTLVALGEQAAAVLGRPQDVEWAVAGGKLWLLQSRPVTAAPPPPPDESSDGRGPALTGSPGAQGSATGRVRVLRTIAEAGRVDRGDIVVCRHTDPAWTPLFRIAGGIVTETGGVLSHAAIVAREHRIPAVIGVPGATSSIRDGSTITIDGSAGSITFPTP